MADAGPAGCRALNQPQMGPAYEPALGGLLHTRSNVCLSILDTRRMQRRLPVNTCIVIPSNVCMASGEENLAGARTCLPRGDEFRVYTS